MDGGRHKKIGEILELNAEGNSAMKRVVDAMSNLIYNPSHAYVIQTPGGKRVTTIAARHGWWCQYYDFELEGGTANEKKLAVGRPFVLEG